MHHQTKTIKAKFPLAEEKSNHEFIAIFEILVAVDAITQKLVEHEWRKLDAKIGEKKFNRLRIHSTRRNTLGLLMDRYR